MTLLAAMLLSAPHVAISAPVGGFPVVGSVGFVWTSPKTAKCAPISEAVAKTFKGCEFSESGAFGLPIAYHTCTRKQGGELLAFRSPAECDEALETMRANAP
ncbi:hypothetical protein [Piscinibacter sp.]|uniref:hypothetical protein n=1 Tax=Piscinibacter sp. TaxID=1903157 RepID=UPI0039E72102